MVITLPEAQCNVYYGDYIDSYQNNVRTRYYLNEGQLIKSTTSDRYYSIPDNVYCLTSEDNIYYYSQGDVYYELFAILSVLAIVYLAYRIILRPFWRRIKP